MLMLVLMLVIDPSPREAQPFTRITRRCRAVRSLALADTEQAPLADVETAWQREDLPGRRLVVIP